MKGDPSIMDILQEIYQTVDNIVQRRMEQSGLNNQIQAIVLGSSNGKYTISVNGAKYTVRDGVGINPQPNTPVWVCVPNNDWNKAYICAGKGTSTGGSGNVDDVYQNGNSVLGEDHIARIRCATPEDIQQLQANFQDGVEAIGNACTRKGSTPASSSLEDTVAAIDAIQTGGNYATLEVNADGIYVAAEDPRGIDAYDIVVVSKDVGQPHTVAFFGPDGNIIKMQANVPYHGHASCNLLDGTTHDGQNFKGWNPSPTDVIRDMNCYPDYGDYIIDPNETHDNWETICADNGAHYPIGTYKNLILDVYGNNDVENDVLAVVRRSWDDYNPWVNWRDITYTALNNNELLFTYRYFIVKIAEGEDGTTSTWLSTSCATMNGWVRGHYSDQPSSGYDENPSQFCGFFRGPYGNWPYAHCDDWETSAIRQFLNGKVFDNLPTPLKEKIKSVNKYTFGTTVTTPSGTRIQKSTYDKIWIPSAKELNSFLSTATDSVNIVPSTFSDIKEFDGIDYSANYTLSYPDPTLQSESRFFTRTSVSRNPNSYQSSNLSSIYYGNNWHLCSFDIRNDNTRFPFGFCL